MTLQVGDRLAGRWAIMEALGSRGRTYRARDNTSDEVVLVRAMVVPLGAEPEAFEQRAAALRGLPSTAVERVVGWVAQGDLFYLVVSEVEGRSLLERGRAGGPASPAEARRLAEVLLSLLRELHEATPPLVHGDLSAAHVIERPNGHLALVGFALEPEGQFAPDYPLPQGVAGPSGDLHALGVLLVFLLTGRAPSELPGRRVTAVPGDLKLERSLAGWLRRLLEPAPAKRFASAGAALAALRATARRGSAVSARALLVGVGVAALLCAALLLWRARPWSSAGPPTRAAVAPASRLVGLLPEPERWRYLDATLLKRVTGHLSAVAGLAVSPDGKRLFTASLDGTVRSWSTADGSAVGLLGSHTGAVGGVAVTPDGARVVSAGGLELKVLGDPKTGASAVAKATLRALALDPKGAHAFAAAVDGTVLGWALPSLVPDFRVEHEAGKALLTVAVSPDGKLVASAGKAASIKLWNAQSGALVAELAPGSRSAVNRLAYSLSGDLLAAAGDDGMVRVWATAKRAEVVAIRASGSELQAVAFSPDGRTLYTTSVDGVLRAWWLPGASLRWSWPRPELRGGALALATSPDGARLYVGNAGGSFDVFELPKAEDPRAVPRAVAFEAKGEPPPSEGALGRARSLLDDWEGDPAWLDRAEKLLLDVLKAGKNPQAQVQLARVRRSRGYRPGQPHDPKALVDALETLEQVLREAPQLYEAHFEKAMTLLVRTRSRPDPNDLQELERELSLAQAARPAGPEVLALSANVMLERGRLAEAEALGVAAVKSSLTRHDASLAFEALAEIYRRQKRFAATEVAHRRVLELRADSAWAHGNFASFLRALGRLDEAAAQVDESMRVVDHGMGRTLRASIATDRGIAALWEGLDPRAARAFFDAALKDDPASSNAHYGLVAVEYYEAAQTGARCSGCGTALDHVLALDPEHAAALEARRRLSQPQ